MKRARFIADLQKYKKLGLDSSVAIYHLEDIEPYSELTEVIFAAVARGALSAVWSTISVAELLTKPFADGHMDRVAVCEQFIHSFAGAPVVSPSYGIAKEAARLRGAYRIRTPDALLLATALNEKADGFITNDAKLRRLKAEGIAIIILEDYV